MKKHTPVLAAMAAALITAPVAALAAGSIPALADQAIGWLAAAAATAVVSALTATVAKLTGARLDKAASDTLDRALTNAANGAIRWMISSAADTPLGRRMDLAIEQMLSYANSGAGGAMRRFGMAAAGDARAHLRDMAEAKLVEQLAQVAPEQLRPVLRGVTVAALAER